MNASSGAHARPTGARMDIAGSTDSDSIHSRRSSICRFGTRELAREPCRFAKAVAPIDAHRERARGNRRDDEPEQDDVNVDEPLPPVGPPSPEA